MNATPIQTPEPVNSRAAEVVKVCQRIGTIIPSLQFFREWIPIQISEPALCVFVFLYSMFMSPFIFSLFALSLSFGILYNRYGIASAIVYYDLTLTHIFTIVTIV